METILDHDVLEIQCLIIFLNQRNKEIREKVKKLKERRVFSSGWDKDKDIDKRFTHDFCFEL